MEEQVNVKLLVLTRYEGELVKPGDILTVDQDTAKRWAKNRIAEVTDEQVPYPEGNEPAAVEAETQTPDSFYSNLEHDELVKLAAERGFQNAKQMKTETLIKKLEESDGNG